MEKIINTKKELKAAIKDKVDTIIVGDEKLAKKIIRVRRSKKVIYQPSKIFSAGNKLAVSGGSASVPSAAGTLAGAEIVVIVAMVILGAIIVYALTRDYEVHIEGQGGATIDENGKPIAKGGGKVILKRKK